MKKTVAFKTPKNPFRNLGLIVFAAALLTIGCMDTPPVSETDYLFFIGQRGVTVDEFNKAMETTEIINPHLFQNTADDPVKRHELIMLQIAESIIFQNRAEAIGIVITDQEFADFLAEIKKDYPEDAFEAVLLENAVPNHIWENGLRNRLLFNKLVEADIETMIRITPEDIRSYVESARAETEARLKTAPPGTEKDRVEQPVPMTEDQVIKLLKRKKAEALFPEWMNTLRGTYPIRVNREIWDKTINMKS